MLIALDYDKTYTLAPAFWDAVLALSKAHGVEVICVTRRAPQQLGPVEAVLGQRLPIISTHGYGKQGFLHAHGIQVDVWIDDDPVWICMPVEAIGSEGVGRCQ
jgi:hypothetical protein